MAPGIAATYLVMHPKSYKHRDLSGISLGLADFVAIDRAMIYSTLRGTEKHQNVFSLAHFTTMIGVADV